MDTAAVLKNLDLVISVDTAIAHLAGALGIPVWVALPFVPDWRWLMDREDSPWYPTMRLFRQTRPGQWEDVFQRIAEALQRRLAASAELRPITVEIAPGELIDKITILEIKSERITDAAKRHHVGTELALLVAARDRAVPGSAELARLATELKAVNEARWQVEDEIRLCERDEDFGPRFVALVRSVYRTNDRRAALNRQINELLGSKLIEEKSYMSYEDVVSAWGSGGNRSGVAECSGDLGEFRHVWQFQGHHTYFFRVRTGNGDAASSAAHNAVGLAGESPVVGIDCLPT